MALFGKNRKALQRRLILEQFETRSLLSGFAAGGIGHDRAAEHVLVHTVSPTSPGVVTRQAALAEASNTATEVHLTATLGSSDATSTATGKVNYQSETEHGKTQSQLVISVKGAAASATLDVAVVDAANNTTSLGQIQTDASGNGKLVLSSKGGATVPVLTAGATVTVSPNLSGQLAAPVATDGGQGEDDDSGESDENETKLTAGLADPTGASKATGMASFHTETEHGTTEAKLSIKVQGAAANDTLDVSFTDSAGTTTALGQITTDANGKGQLRLSSKLPAIQAGATITVSSPATGTITGAFGTPQAPSATARLRGKGH